MKYLLIVLLAVHSVFAEEQLPSFFKKCKKNDAKLDECVTNSVNDAWTEFVKGHTKYNFPTLKPLFKAGSMTANIGNILKATIIDAEIKGLDGIKFKNVRFDLKKNVLTILFEQPLFNVYGDYKIEGNGVVLGFTVRGTGFTNTTFLGGLYELTYEYDLKKINNKEYIDIKQNKADIKKVDKVIYQLETGNKVLSTQITRFMNENWVRVHDLSKAELGSILGRTTKDVLQKFFSIIPFDNFFQS